MHAFLFLEAKEAVEVIEVSNFIMFVEVIGATKVFMPGNHSVCKVHAVFLFLVAKEAVEFIEASDVIMSAEVIEATEVFRTPQILKINNILAGITLF